MDLQEIKEILGNGGGKIVVVENGKPTMVVLSYGEYKTGRAKSGCKNSTSPTREHRRAVLNVRAITAVLLSAPCRMSAQRLASRSSQVHT